MGVSQTFWWSPKGNRLAFTGIDETNVTKMKLLFFETPNPFEPQINDHSYPMVSSSLKQYVVDEFETLLKFTPEQRMSTDISLLKQFEKAAVGFKVIKFKISKGTEVKVAGTDGSPTS